jgi:hypothetical protein
MHAIAAVHLDDLGLVTIGPGVRGGTAECFSPVSGQPLRMLRVESVADRIGQRLRRLARDGARRRRDAAFRPCHPPQRRQFASVHHDNRFAPLQGSHCRLLICRLSEEVAVSSQMEVNLV